MKKFLLVMAALSVIVSSAFAEESLIIDKEKGEIIIPAEVNGKYLVSPTKHALSYYKIKPEDMKARNSSEGKSAEGSKLSVFLTWEGSNGEIPLDDAVISEVANGEARPLDLRFSGNLDFAMRSHPGCFICLDSCAAGISTNAAWPTGAMNNKEVSFKGNAKVLPPDGTKVNVIVRLVK